MEYLIILVVGVAVNTETRSYVVMAGDKKHKRVERIPRPGYSRGFVKDFGKLAESFDMLLKKNAFLWDAVAQEAFE